MSHAHDLISSARLVVLDYDKTIARTDLPSPNGLTVEKAYALALDHIFSTSGLLENIDGLRNRAPAEIARAVLGLNWKPHAAEAYHFYYQNKRWLSGLVPEGKGVDLIAAHHDCKDVAFCAELIARVKLRFLLGEVGKDWPLPCDGVLDFLRARPGAIGIISSGHDVFIRRSFAAWGVPCPDLMLTDDDMRGLPGPSVRKTKPYPILFEYFLDQARVCGTDYRPGEVVYIGDDLVKDGGLAKNAGTGFVWYNPNRERNGSGVAEFHDWHELTRETVS